MKKWRKAQAGIVCLLIISILALNLQGCASMPQGSGTAIGGVSGAALGGAIGGAFGGKKGAIIGALLGGVAGALIGTAVESRMVKDYQTTKEEQGYEPSQGEVVKITDFSIAPAAAAPGTQVAMRSTYYIMTPNPDQEVPITEVRIIKVRDPSTQQYRELGRTAARPVTVKAGTRQADDNIPIGEDAREGIYLISFQVARDGRRDEKELQLTVTRNQAMLNAPGSKMAQVTVPSKTSLAAMGESKPTAPASQAKVRSFVASKVSAKANLRDGPGTGYKIIGAIQQGERFPVVESITNPPWHKIRLKDGREAWVSASLGVVEE